MKDRDKLANSRTDRVLFYGSVLCSSFEEYWNNRQDFLLLLAFFLLKRQSSIPVILLYGVRVGDKPDGSF